MISSSQYEQTALGRSLPNDAQFSMIREMFYFERPATPKRYEPVSPLHVGEFVQLLCSS